MLRKSLLIFILYFPVFTLMVMQVPDSKSFTAYFSTVSGQNLTSNSLLNNEFFFRMNQLSMQQLSDTGDYFFLNSIYDTALICYSLLINEPFKDSDYERQKRVAEAQNKTAIIYYTMSNYRKAYELWIKTLLFCEKYNYLIYQSKVYPNIGNIYFRFNNYDLAKHYYLKGLDLCQDSAAIVLILNNLCASELENGNLDSAFYFLDKSLQISKRHNEVHKYHMLNNLAWYYKKSKQYDMAFYYFRLSLEEAIRNNKTEKEADYLSDLGTLFFEEHKIDSAVWYIKLSNNLAEKNGFQSTLEHNYHTLSQIEESKGNIKKAFDFYKKYAALKDSVYNNDIFGDINKIQHLYEVAKINEQIEQLAIEQKISERIIHYQKVIWFITMLVLFMVSFVLIFIFFQKRKLNKAYKTLFEKNIEIMSLQTANSPENYSEKYKKSALTHNMQDELLDKILMLMKNTSVICNYDFSVDKLSELVDSNPTYVSQVINNALQQNFRSFLNEYRIKEAQRLFSEPDAIKYTIESVAYRVGFKSRSAFRDVFKEITGVSPIFYMKSAQEQQKM